MGTRARAAIAAALLVAASGVSGCEPGLLTPSTSPSDVRPGDVPFRLEGAGGAVMIVPVTVNGAGPFDFALDTGATLTCIDVTLADELLLPERPGQVGLGAGIAGQGAIKLVEIDALSVGEAAATDLTACVIDLQHIQGLGVDIRGLVGLNFLKNYRVTIDFEREVLRLDDPAAPVSPPGDGEP